VEILLPRHDPTHLQLPVEAVKVFLDRAIDTMKKNEDITAEDWDWFYKYLDYLKIETRPETITK
jgi:hypothetical protein